MTEPGTNGAASGPGLGLPARTGAAPAVTHGIPHIQLDENSSDELMQEMTKWAFSLPGVEEQPSRASLPGARALTAAPDAPTPRSEAMIVGQEFAHIHPQPRGGSMHMRLPAERVTEVVDMGWGELHPFAVEGSVPNLLMIYAPRSHADLDVIKVIIRAAVEYATGVEEETGNHQGIDHE